MKFTPESTLALCTAAPIMIGFICRARVLTFGKTKLLPTLFHMACGLLLLTISCSMAQTGDVRISDWLSLALCALWLVWSYPTWKGLQAPEHVQTKPAPLNVMEGQDAAS